MHAKNCINSTVTVEDLIFGFESRGLHWIAKVLWHLVVFIKKAPSLTHILPRNIFANHANRKRNGVISPGIVSFATQIPRNTIHGRCSQEGVAGGPGGLLAGFKCSFYVVCLDVSQQLDYMVGECTKSMLHWTVVTFYWQAGVDRSSRNREELQHGQFAPVTVLQCQMAQQLVRKKKRMTESRSPLLCVRCSPLRNCNCLSFPQKAC